MWGALIGAAGNLIGGWMGAKAQEKANQQNIQLQKDFAQQGIQWKVADAKAAGIHPLAALGAQTHSFSPAVVGTGDHGIAAAGQNIGRAIDASRSQNSRAVQLSEMLAQTQIHGVQLDNEIKKQRLLSDMALKSQAGQPPGIPGLSDPFSGTELDRSQGNVPQTGKLEFERKIAPGAVGNPVVEAGENPEVALYRSRQGRWAPQIPQQLSEPFEKDWLSYYQWIYRNKVLPGFGSNMSPPPWVKVPPGYKWQYNIGAGEYQLVPRRPYGRGAADY